MAKEKPITDSLTNENRGIVRAAALKLVLSTDTLGDFDIKVLDWDFSEAKIEVEIEQGYKRERLVFNL